MEQHLWSSEYRVFSVNVFMLSQAPFFAGLTIMSLRTLDRCFAPYCQCVVPGPIFP